MAVAESNLAFLPRPSTSFSGAMRSVSVSVFDLSLMGSWRIMAVMDGSALARRISSWSASVEVARWSMTLIPRSAP